MTTIRVLIALASMHNLVIHRMNVKTAFLNDELDEEVYMEQPKGYIVPGQGHKVYNYVYCNFNGNKGVFICLYVDDMLIFGIGLQQVEETKNFFFPKFSMKDIGVVDVILGIKITRTVLLHCDNEATLARAYNMVYNCKSRHIGLGHS
ncbi:hypothetical protein LIER_24886 [Lithospermum erythrorhizon]|uniref:Reverse transcriptase Ty1/copia-type domain-containing protein n=1 Tax=Lithospermum erythrorhizon TaxID=34254 RepID=A0AAV3R5S9_LITER